MIHFIKNNKLLSILIILSLIVFLIGFLSFNSLDSSIKKISLQNILDFISLIKSNSYSFSKIFIPTFFRDSILIIVIWIFGISIIGIIIILFFYFFELLLFSLEVSSLLFYIQKIPLNFLIIFTIIKSIKLFIYLIFTYYSSSFSIMLFRLFFLKKEYPIKKIFKRYLKLFILLLFCIIGIILIESLLYSKILIHFI